MSKVACGWKYQIDHIDNGVIYGDIEIPLQSGKSFKHPMKWNADTGLPVDVTQYPTRYYMRIVNEV